MIKDEIIKALKTASGTSEVDLEFPEKEEFGDYTTNVALKIGGAPRKAAEEIVKKLKTDKKLQKIVSKIEIAGPGFINFRLQTDVLLDNLMQIEKDKEKYGMNSSKKDKKVCVEYTDPNPFKEFHIGHLISNVTGETIARFQEACGAVVWRADYFGDVGVHVAKSIWGIKKKMKEDGLTLEDLAKKPLLERVNYMGQGYAMGTRAFEESESAKEEIGKLNTVIYIVAQKMWEKEGKKIEINYNKEGHVTQKEIDAVYDLYVTGRKWSLEYFETIYKRLGTKFNGYYPESKVAEVGYKYVLDNIGKVFTKSEGAVIFEGEKFGLHTRVFINHNNLPTYEAKELGLAPSKYEDFKYDESIIVVGKEIKEYFAVLVEALKQVNPKLGNVTHPIFTGMVNLPEGKMSSRKGNVVTVTGLMDKLKEMASEKVGKGDYAVEEKDDILEKIAVGALKYAFLKNHIGQDFIFNLGESLSLEGNSGPYLQYTIARTNSVLAKAKKSKLQNKIILSKLTPEEILVARELTKFEDVVLLAAKSLTPNILCNYLFELAQKFNSFYNGDRIIGSENEEYRLLLTSGVGQVLKNGLTILGIGAPERM